MSQEIFENCLISPVLEAAIQKCSGIISSITEMSQPEVSQDSLIAHGRVLARGVINCTLYG